MTIARSRQISLQDTPYYHVVSRCIAAGVSVREDAHSGQSYEHRRRWVVEQVGPIVATVCHRCVCLCGDEQSLSPGAQGRAGYRCQLERAKVAERWAALFQWPLLARRWYQGNP